MAPENDAPLESVRVIEFAHLFPGPYAGLILQRLGATVIKVEPPTGDTLRATPPFIETSGGGAGAIFCALNKDKRSITLDLKDDAPQAVDNYHRLVQDADIVIDGYGAGVAERLGIGYDALTQGHDNLTYVDVTGYGPQGPLAHEPGHDITYQAWVGALNEDHHGAPDLPTADATGALWAALLATAHHATPGNKRLDASLAGSLNAATFIKNAAHLTGLDVDPLHATVGYGVYACQNDKSLALAALEPPFWRNLTHALGDQALVNTDRMDPKQAKNAHERLTEIFQTQPREAWLARLREARVPCAPIRSTREALEKPLEIASTDPPGALTKEDLMGAPPLGEANDAFL